MIDQKKYPEVSKVLAATSEVQQLAIEFARVLEEWLTPVEMAQIRKGKADPDDFCDANMAMDKAFRKVFGRATILPSDVEAGRYTSAEEDKDVKLWRDAWEIAKANKYSLNPQLGFSFSATSTAPNPKDVKQLASKFSQVLNEWLTPEEMSEVRQRNDAEPKDSGICHSYDFCDANMAMFEAFEKVLNRKPRIVDEEASEEDREWDTNLWSEAWTLAMKSGFEPGSQQEFSFSSTTLTVETLAQAKVIQSEDGYKFYRTPEGTWADHLDPAKRDMTFESDQALVDLVDSGEMTFQILE
jgi:hypothetical protein